MTPNRWHLALGACAVAALTACGGDGESPNWNVDALDGSELAGSPGGTDGGGETPAPAPAPAPGPAPSPSPSPAPGPAACSTLALCDDFEDAPAGGLPDAARWSIGGPNCFSQAGTATIDAGVAHSGTKSVRLDPGPNYCDHVFIQSPAIDTLGSVRYARFYLRLAEPVGDTQVTLGSLTDASQSTDAQTAELRLGSQSGTLMWGRSVDGASLPSLSPNGISMGYALPARTWICIEFRIDQDSGNIQTWVDGEAPAGLQADGAPTADVDQAWINQNPAWRPRLTDLKLGWEAYGGATNTVWIDDVAVGATRIGCTPP